jgi:nucleotide-binding universal stress UspA family protein
MYQHILIATDGSAIGSRAVAYALALARRGKVRATIVTVTEPWSAIDMATEAHRSAANPVARFEKAAAVAAKRVLQAAVKKAKLSGVATRIVHVPDQHPADGILQTAKKKHCDLIVMGSHGRRGFRRLLLGSQAYEVLSRSKVPTLIVR